MKQFSTDRFLAFSTALLFAAWPASAQHHSVTPPSHSSATALIFAQQTTPDGTRQAEDAVERAVRRYRIGVEGGVGLDPELIMFGAHGAFGPFFTRGLDFRPGVEFGVGEVTTTLGINLDVLYTLPGASSAATWMPYVGAGPNFALSHRGFESDDDDEDDDRNRFDFSDTDFEGGINFIAGVRRRNGMFLEMKATAYGVSNVRLLVGFNF